jgi:hypothetical protein
MFGLNPWIILAVFAVFVGSNAVSYTKGFGNGEDARELLWVQKEGEQRLKAEGTIAALREVARKKEMALYALNLKTEKDHADALEKVNRMRIANGRLIAAHGGLFDKNGRPVAGSGSGSAADSADASGSTGTSAGCKLSDAASGNLLDLAFDADRAATYANTCKAHVVSLYDQIRTLCPAVTPSQ